MRPFVFVLCVREGGVVVHLFFFVLHAFDCRPSRLFAPHIHSLLLLFPPPPPDGYTRLAQAMKFGMNL